MDPKDNATLRDASVVTETEVETKVETKPTDDTTVLAAAEKEAAEIGKILLESGVTKDQVSDLLQAPSALNTLRYMIQNDPEQFLRELEKADPVAGDNFQQKIADLYVKRYGTREETATAKDDVNSKLLAEIAELKEKTTRLETAQQQRDAAIAVAAAKDRYNNRVKELFELEAVKNLGLTKSETKAMKSRLDAELASDPNMVKRISNGNFVDVPRTFQTIVSEWAGDKKSAADEATKARERTSNQSFAEFMPGADMFTANIPKETFDSWDTTEDAFAKALTGAGRK